MPRVEKRLTEKLLMKSFNAARPKIVGWLLDGSVSALKNQDTTVIEDLPRLADFCVFAQAAEEGLGLKPRSRLTARTARTPSTVSGSPRPKASSPLKPTSRAPSSNWHKT